MKRKSTTSIGSRKSTTDHRIAKGCTRGFRCFGFLGVFPIGFPVAAVHQRAEARHAVGAADAPAGAGLFEARTDHVFAAPFRLATPDALAARQPLGVVHVILAIGRIVPQALGRIHARAVGDELGIAVRLASE